MTFRNSRQSIHVAWIPEQVNGNDCTRARRNLAFDISRIDVVRIIDVRKNGDRLRGDNGRDELYGDTGNDIMLGGAGKDELQGGTGNDKLIGGPEADMISAGAGIDVIDARDKSVDEIACGAGKDLVMADKHDKVGRDCEKVQRIGGRP